MKGRESAQYLPLPSESYKMVLFEDEPRCACKSQLPISAPQVKMHFCIKGYCVFVETHRVFSLAFVYYICELAAFSGEGKNKLTRERAVSA